MIYQSDSPWHDEVVGSGAEVPIGELRHGEDEDADDDVDQVEGRQTQHQRVEVSLDF